MNVVTVPLRTPRSCYATPRGARDAARRMFKKGENAVRFNGRRWTWSMDNVKVKPAGFWMTEWACWVEIPEAEPEPAKRQREPMPCGLAEAVRIAAECRLRTAEILASHGFEPF